MKSVKCNTSDVTQLTIQNPIGRTGIVGLGNLFKVGGNRVDIFIVVLNNPRKVLVEVTRQTQGEHVDKDMLQLPFQMVDLDTTQNRRRTLEDELGNNFKPGVDFFGFHLYKITAGDGKPSEK